MSKHNKGSRRPRRGRPTLQIRIKPDTLRELRRRAGPAARGFPGGVSQFVRWLIDRELHGGVESQAISRSVRS
ncbi:MAG: hypothetical protein KC931_22805, partial [Candidatus Omnitrophica bacterium]|nr:hypothetical protein [Candidatus Omnitrophota bacterium]